MKRSDMGEAAWMLLRVVAGLLFLQSGGTKLFHWFGGPPGGSALSTQITIGAWMEVIGGVLIIAGLFTRIVAFILSGEMAIAYFQFHQPKGTWPAENHGQNAVLFCFIFLAFAAIGAGKFSLDALLSRKRTET